MFAKFPKGKVRKCVYFCNFFGLMAKNVEVYVEKRYCYVVSYLY